MRTHSSQGSSAAVWLWAAAGALLLSTASADPVRSPRFAAMTEFAPMMKRAVDCPGDYFSCEDQGSAFLGVCCRQGQQCSLDANNQAACCPKGNVCTGTAPGGGATPTLSYVDNTFFPFPYIPTSFKNGAACSSAVSQCSANYVACTSDLTGGDNGYGVTIVVPGGGGTTVTPTHATVALATATSVCQSLSREACHNLQNSQCAQTGNSGGFYVGTENAASRPTAACMAGVIAGVGFGLMGGHM